MATVWWVRACWFLREWKLHCLNSNLHMHIPSSVHCGSREASPDLFEPLSVQSCNGRTEAFSYHLDTRQACEMWAGTMFLQFSVACLQMMATFKKEARSSLLANPHHISVLSFVKLHLCGSSGSLVSIASSDFTSYGNYWGKDSSIILALP